MIKKILVLTKTQKDDILSNRNAAMSRQTEKGNDMRLNVVYFVNVIDQHLAKIAGLSYSFKDASLKKIVESEDDNETATCGMQRSRLMSIAQNKGDEFATMFLAGENWQNDYRAWGTIEEYRNALAHGRALNPEGVKLANELTPGYDFDEKGYFTLSADMEAAFSKIKTTVVNNVEHLEGFRRITSAFCDMMVERNIIFQSAAKYVIRRYRRPIKGDAPKSLCRLLWKVNNIRNRYVHTGRITESERACCEKLAALLNTNF